jgi:hypothetical protein
MVNSMNAEKGMLCWGNPGIKKVGKCHAPHSTPRIRLAESIDLVASRAREQQGRGVGEMRRRTAAWIGWLVCYSSAGDGDLFNGFKERL